jgi:alkanesulfonate monooxygenase SsuD/methylene tetrahydromethanopterin reductase-like flavin-dependent oxidoreductase (luciferase family)
MELGVFSLADVNPDSDDTVASRIDDIIDYGRLTERYGLDVFGVGEHHTAMYAVSSPRWCSQRLRRQRPASA